jgi:hypothetical protein
VTDIEIEWGGAEVTPASPDLPAVFEGDSLTLLGRVTGTVPSECTVRMTTTCGPAEWKLRVPGPSPDNEMIATLWAHRRIGDLEASHSTWGRGRARRRENKQLIKLSEEFGVLCSQTSFVALEHRSLEERNEGKPACRRVPVQLARGWGGIDTIDRICAAPAILADACMDLRGPMKVSSAIRRPAERHMARYMVGAPLASGVFHRKAAARTPSVPVFDDPLLSLLAAQQAEGWFKWESGFDEILREAGLSRDQCRSAVETVVRRNAVDREAADLSHLIDTVIVLFLLQTRYAERQRLWKRAYLKASRYIERRIENWPLTGKECLSALERGLEIGQK